MSKQDLVILVPDGAYRAVLPAILERPKSLGLRKLSFRIVLDPLRDSSPQAVNLLRPFQRTHASGLVLRDFQGSGKERTATAQTLERRIEKEMVATGWSSAAARAVVVAPEFEDWLASCPRRMSFHG